MLQKLRGCSIVANAADCLSEDRGFESLQPRQTFEDKMEKIGLAIISFTLSLCIPFSWLWIITVSIGVALLLSLLGDYESVEVKGYKVEIHSPVEKEDK